MATKKSVSQKSIEPQGSSIPKQSKIIGLVLAVGLGGTSVLWYVGKNKIQSLSESLDDVAKKYGYTLEKDPLEFSGFPFSLKATFPKFKATTEGARGEANILQGEPIVISPTLWNPGHVTITGPLTYGAYVGETPLMTVKVQKLKGHFSQGKDGALAVPSLTAYDVDLARDGDQKILSVKEIDFKRSEKTDGALTHFKSEIVGEGVEVASGHTTSIGIDKVSLSTSLASPYKTEDEVMKAFTEFNQNFSRDIEKRCEEGAEYLPPLLETTKAIGASKGSFDFSFGIKGGEYDAKLDCAGQVKDDFPEIKIHVELENADKFLDLTVESGAITTSVSRAISLFLAGIGKEESGKRKIDLVLENKELKLGEKVILDLKDTNLDQIKLPVQYCAQIKAMAAMQKKAEPADNPAGSLAGLSPAV
jgi:hypothetical protein